jgi:myo-inositol catabolism protein IolC
LCELAAESVRRDEVGERLLAVDLDHRQQFAEAALELGVTRDVDLLELERLLSSNALEHTARGRAQVAVGRVVEDDARYG